MKQIPMVILSISMFAIAEDAHLVKKGGEQDIVQNV